MAFKRQFYIELQVMETSSDNIAPQRVGDAVKMDCETEADAHHLCALIHDIGETIKAHE
jgi:hypothetical protein